MTPPVPPSQPPASALAPSASRGGANGPPGEDTGPPAFASVLNSHVARTAIAEGQKNTGHSSGGHRDGRGQDTTDELPGRDPGGPLAAILDALQAAIGLPGAARVSDPTATSGAPATGAEQAASATPTPATAAPPATSPASALTTNPAGDAPTTTAASASDGSAPATTANAPQPGPSPATVEALPAPTGTATPPPAQPPTTAAQPPAGQSVTPSPATPPSDPSVASPVPVTPGDPTPAPNPTSPTPAQQPTTSAPADSTPPAPTASTLPQGTPSAAHATAPATQPGTPHAASNPGATAASFTTQGDAGQAQPAAGSDPISPVSLQSATLPSTAAAPATPVAAGPAAGVTLAHVIETVRATVEMAANRGYSQARIELSPPELGSIRIHLQQTADGLVARVVASHAAAAQTLQQGGSDLRQSLEQSGVHLLRLDIEASGQQGAQPREQQASAAGTQPQNAEEHDGAASDDVAPIARVQLPGGAIVDVLA